MRWTAILDGAALLGLVATTWGWLELGNRCGLGCSLALLWGGGWTVGLSIWIAASVPKRRR